MGVQRVELFGALLSLSAVVGSPAYDARGAIPKVSQQRWWLHVHREECAAVGTYGKGAAAIFPAR